MSEWWQRLWHDPISRDPWALGLLILLGLALFGPVAIMIGRDMFRRRRKVRDMEPTDTTPPGGSSDQRAVTDEPGQWATSAEDRQEADRQEAATAIGGARAGGSQLATWSPEMDPPPVQHSSPQRDAEDTVVQEARWASEGLPPVREDGERLQMLRPPEQERPPYPSRLAARASVPRVMVEQHRGQCEHCGGTGYVPNISDYLRESIAIIAPNGDDAVRTFYGVLFRADPDLVSLFPGNPTEGDLGTDHKGARQRELLLTALVALSDLYDPDSPERMEKLDTALGSFGRKHAAFVRKNGTIKGATLDEYKAVKDALFATLVQFAGKAWKAEYTESWSQAYDYAAAVMIAEQQRSGFSAPRFPRA